MLGLTFSSKLDYGSYIISLAKTACKKIRALIHSMKFLSAEVALYFCKSTKQPCMKYCMSGLVLLLLVATWNCWISYKNRYEGLLVLHLLPLLNPQLIVEIFSVGITLIDALLVFLIDCMISVNIPRCYMDIYVNSFFPHTARLQNSLPIKCFLLIYNLSRFMPRINRHLLMFCML